MKLWIDDLRVAPEGWTWAKTPSEAIGFLEAGGVSEVSFDHDLGGDLTAYEVACWIEQAAAEGRIGRLEWRIHSANPVGRKRIESAMRSAERFWGAFI